MQKLKLKFNDMKEGDIVISQLGRPYVIIKLVRTGLFCKCDYIRKMKAKFLYGDYITFYEFDRTQTRTVYRFKKVYE